MSTNASSKLDPNTCLSCGCEVYPAGHPGNMCRTIRALRTERDAIVAALERAASTIVALRAERDAETRRADDNDAARLRAEDERDWFSAELVRVRTLIACAIEFVERCAIDYNDIEARHVCIEMHRATGTGTYDTSSDTKGKQ